MKQKNSKRRKKRRVRRIFRSLLRITILCLCIPLLLLTLNRISRLRHPVPSVASDGEQQSSWELILVNDTHPIPENYTVDLLTLANRQRVDERIYPDLQKMFDDARSDGLQLYVREGYRTHEEQQKIMDYYIQLYLEQGYSRKDAETQARSYVAVPGTSEHELGLAVDINADRDYVSDSEVYSWLSANSYLYGFVQRYPSDKTSITRINNEPWHYRYVGKEAALKMTQENLCLEEYLNSVDSH